METPDPPNDTPGASKQVVLTPHDIPRILSLNSKLNLLDYFWEAFKLLDVAGCFGTIFSNNHRSNVGAMLDY